MFPSNNLSRSDKNNEYDKILLKCIKPQSYCFTFLDYLRKIFHISHIDYNYFYSQILYCFTPKEMYKIF